MRITVVIRRGDDQLNQVTTMTFSLKSAVLALATLAALPVIGHAASPLQCASQAPDLREVALNSTPQPMLPSLFNPPGLAVTTGLNSSPRVTVRAPTARPADTRSAQSESHVPAQGQYGKVAAQSEQNAIQQGTWLAAYRPGKDAIRVW
jgi:hypothetical protein